MPDGDDTNDELYWDRPAGHDGSASKALQLLSAFAGTRAVLGVTEVAERTKIPKSTAHRLLAVLVYHGYVQRHGDRYCLSTRLFEIGHQVRICRPHGLREQATPYLAELFAETHEIVHFAVLSGVDVLYLGKLYGHGALPCPTVVGGRRPAYTTALGKAILAYSSSDVVQSNLEVNFQRLTAHTITNPSQLQRALSRVQEESLAVDYEESRRGLNCLAVPVRDMSTGRAVAAFSVSSAHGKDLARRYARILTRTADSLSTHLRTLTPPVAS